MLDYVIKDGECGVEKAFSVIGSKWASDIIRVCFTDGSNSFSDFKGKIDGISDSKLAAQLNSLADNGILEKKEDAETGRSGFCLTQKGLDIVPALRLMHYFALDMGYGDPTPAKQLEFTRKLIGSKWKARIIWMLCHAEIARFNELHDSIEGISFKVLKQQLADMEEKGIISRTEYEGKVPKVEYSLTSAGKESYLIVQSLADWCRKYGMIKQRIIIDS